MLDNRVSFHKQQFSQSASKYAQVSTFRGRCLFRVPRRKQRLRVLDALLFVNLHTVELTLSSISRSAPYLIQQEYVEISPHLHQGRSFPYGGAVALSIYRVPAHRPRRAFRRPNDLYNSDVSGREREAFVDGNRSREDSCTRERNA